MSFYRTLLAAVAAVVIAAPVFADDTTDTQSTNETTMQTSDTSGTTTSNTGNEQTQKININTASAKDLLKVKGLNKSKARAIIAYRKKHGNFKSIDDLANVKGFNKMSPDALSTIENQLTVE